MSDTSPSGLHTPQQRSEQDPQPYENAPQDQGDSNEFLDQLAGRNTDQTAYFGAEDVEPLQGLTVTDQYQGETDVNQVLEERGAEQFGLLVEPELREGETDAVMEAVEEGLAYMPPIDPPITTDYDSLESVQVNAGFGVSARSVDEGEDLSVNDQDRFFEPGDDMTALVRRAIRADSATTHLADRIQIATVNGTVVLRGVVDDLDDTDNLVAVVSDIPGVETVRDETVVPGL